MAGTDSGAGPKAPVVPADGLSLFERIEQADLPEADAYILWRGEHCFALLNAYPYGTGHLMVVPKRAVPDLERLTEAEHSELWSAVRCASAALRHAYVPDGINVGINIGRAAGASEPDHLHVHCLPRWHADTNFTVAVAETRFVPEPLDLTWRKLRAAWPSRPPAA